MIPTDAEILDQLRYRLREAEVRLQRYEFDEAHTELELDQKLLAKEIDSVHPMHSDNPDWPLHRMAMTLVGERRGKYELIDLVYYLLLENKRLQALVPVALDDTKTL